MASPPAAPTPAAPAPAAEKKAEAEAPGDKKKEGGGAAEILKLLDPDGGVLMNVPPVVEMEDVVQRAAIRQCDGERNDHKRANPT